ncbi:hypothetical protein JW859_07665 [bacterium]|nr:hypothetical protein [bacterium]
MLLWLAACAQLLLIQPCQAQSEDRDDLAERVTRLSYFFPEEYIDAEPVNYHTETDRQVFYAGAMPDTGGLPDRLEASSTSVSEEGVVTAYSGTLYITSLVEGQTLVAGADRLTFDTNSGEAELVGNVSLSLQNDDLKLECDELYYDPLMGTLDVSGVSVNLPLALLVSEERLSMRGPRAAFGNDIYAPLPETIRVTAGRARLSLDANSREYSLTNVTLSHHPRPDPDLFLHADEMRLTRTNQVKFRNISLHVSGIELISWPMLTRSLEGGERMISLDFPIIRFEKDVGIAWKQAVHADLNAVKANCLLDYANEYGLLTNIYVYSEPLPGIELGAESGTRSDFDINRTTVERRSDLNLILRQDLDINSDWLRNLKINSEYGKISTFTAGQPDLGIPAERNEDTRFYIDGIAELPLIPIADNLYITSALTGRYVDYADANQHYHVSGLMGGLIYSRDGFDHFIIYRGHRIKGDALFSFDEVRQREVDFMTSVRLHRDWRHVVRGIYDIAEEEFNQLRVSALKRQKTYEIGLYWDFARESAGLELGLLVD